MEEIYCAICNEEITEKNRSIEHIIPNAIGGILKTYKLFCKNCNSKFGSNLDAAFVKNFSFINASVDIRRDRKTSNTSTTGYCFTDNGELIDCKIDKDTVSFIKDNQYKSVKKDELPILLYMVNLDNESFKKGFEKIAFDYALYCGIKVENLEKIFDMSGNKLIDDFYFIPFVPLNIFDEKLEESILYELKHILRLFSIKNYLFCYIELFSTFQYYVLLSDSYSGPEVYNDFCQKTSIKETEISFSIHRQKDVLILASQYNLDLKKISKICDNDIDKIAKEVERQARNKYNSENNEISYENEINSLIDAELLLKLKKDKKDFFAFSRLYNFYTCVLNNSELNVGEFNQTDCVNYENISERFIDKKKYKILNYNLIKNELEIYPISLYEKLADKRDFPKDYCFRKFDVLEKYIRDHSSKGENNGI